MLKLIIIKGEILMKKIIIFLSILLVILIGGLVYLSGWPYLKEYLDSRKVSQVDSSIVKGNYVSGSIIVDTNGVSNNNVDNITSQDDTNEVPTEKLADIVSKMTKDEIEMYNISFTGYEGKSMNGQMVKVLLEEVYRSNNSNIGNPGLFVAVSQDYIDRIDSIIGKPGDRDNDSNTVHKANSKVYDLKDETKSTGTYDIECRYDSGLVVEVNITKVK